MCIRDRVGDVGGVSGDVGCVGRHVIVGGFELGAVNGVSAACLLYTSTLLKHENLGSALSYMLANKLSSPIMPAIAIREVVEEAYAADPEMIASAACDIQAVSYTHLDVYKRQGRSG